MLDKIFDEQAIPDYAVLSVEQTRKLLGVSESTRCRWVSEGKFPKPVKYVGGSGYPVAVIREYFKREAEKAVAELRTEMGAKLSNERVSRRIAGSTRARILKNLA